MKLSLKQMGDAGILILQQDQTCLSRPPRVGRVPRSQLSNTLQTAFIHPVTGEVHFPAFNLGLGFATFLANRCEWA